MKGCFKFVVIAFLLLLAASFARYYFILTPEERETEVRAFSANAAEVEDAPSGRVIPGLMPVDLYLNLEEKGFTTEKRLGGAQKEFRCTLEFAGGEHQATAFGSAASNVTAISAHTTIYGEANTSALAAPFLGYVATLSYDGAEPEQARAWVEANLGKEAETMFGPVKFQLFGEPPTRTRILRMSMDPMTAIAKPSSLPTIKTLEKPKVRKDNLVLPKPGALFAEVVKEHGKPSIQDADTGWAIWTSFKVKFKEGRAVEVSQ
jgi:hypothetical protein